MFLEGLQNNLRIQTKRNLPLKGVMSLERWTWDF